MIRLLRREIFLKKSRLSQIHIKRFALGSMRGTLVKPLLKSRLGSGEHGTYQCECFRKQHVHTASYSLPARGDALQRGVSQPLLASPLIRGALISTTRNGPRHAAPTFFAILSVCPDTPRNPYRREQAPRTKRHLTLIECALEASTYVDMRSTQ